jgi:hypothetical protein
MTTSLKPDPAIKQADIAFDHFVASVEDQSHCMRLAPQPTPDTAIYMNECGDWWIEPTNRWVPIDYAPWDMPAGPLAPHWWSDQPWDEEA